MAMRDSALPARAEHFETAVMERDAMGVSARSGVEDGVAEILSLDARRIIALLGRRWSLPILASLIAGPRRHNQLRRAVDGVADKVLVETLRALEDEQLVDRSLFAEVPLRVEYQLTDKARRLCHALGAVDDWAHREAALLGTSAQHEERSALHARATTRRLRSEA